MWIRDKQIKHRPHGRKMADKRQDCFFLQENGGLVDVVYIQVIRRLLANQSFFEPAFENLAACTFDHSGRQIEKSPVAIVEFDGRKVEVQPQQAPEKIEEAPQPIGPSEEELEAARKRDELEQQPPGEEETPEEKEEIPKKKPAPKKRGRRKKKK